jgi:uncharacterized protein YycO
MITITDPSAEVQPLLGDFGLIHDAGGTWLDQAAEKLIEFGTDSPFCHAFVYVGNGQIVEAVRHVKVSPVTDYANITWSTGRLGPEHTPDPLQRQQIARAAMSFVGQQYNLLDIVAIAFAQARLGHIVDGDEWWVKRLSDDHMQICSQLVVNAYRLASIDLFPGTLSGLVSPGDLGRLLRV